MIIRNKNVENKDDIIKEVQNDLRKLYSQQKGE